MSRRFFYPLFLLLIPIFGNVFFDEFDWSLFDFILMGIILISLGFLINLIIDKFKKRSYKIILIIITLFFFILLYVELAVGIIGTPFAGN
jgi:hypothetical protein